MKRSSAHALLLFLGGCTFHETVEVALEVTLEGARSAIVAIESAEGIQVSALDLATRPIPALPVLEHDAEIPMTVSARFFLSTLEELEIETEGPLPAGEGGHIPRSQTGMSRDQVCQPGDQARCVWRNGELGPKLEAFTSPALPRSRCRRFEAIATHFVGPDSAESRVEINSGARLDRDAVVLQGDSRLLRVSEAGVRLWNSEVDGLTERIPPPWQRVITLGDRALLQGCSDDVVRMALLDPGGGLTEVTTEGLGGCPSALSVWQGTVYALTSSVALRKLAPDAEAWSPLTSFPESVHSHTFLAFAQDTVAAVRELPDFTYPIRTSSPLGGESYTVPLPERTDLGVATPTSVGDRAFFTFSGTGTGVIFVSGRPGDGFEIVGRRGSQMLRALAEFEGTVLGAGAFGSIVQFDPHSSSGGSCVESPIVTSASIRVLEYLGEDRFLLAGDTRSDPTGAEPRPEAQRVAIARALPP